jgi:hypothetical protein
MNFKTAKKKLFLQKKPAEIFRASNFRLTAKKFSQTSYFVDCGGTGVPPHNSEKKQIFFSFCFLVLFIYTLMCLGTKKTAYRAVLEVKTTFF